MSLVKIKRKDINKLDITIPTKRKTGKDIFKELKCDYLVNLALYDMASGENIVYMEDENKPSGFLFTDEGIGTNGKDIVWTSKEQAYKDNVIKDYVSGAPILIKNGNIKIEWGNKISTQIQGKHKRTAIGFNNEYLIIYCSDDSITLNTLANRMLEYGCNFAINCDGGGSQYLQTPTNVLKYSYRKNASWLAIWMKEVENVVYKYKNNSSKSKPVYETTECKKKIGSLDPYEECTCLYEMYGYKVVMYNITGKPIKKVGFIKED